MRMKMNELSNLLSHYGRVTTDANFCEEILKGVKSYTRIRTFAYNGKHFYHHMVDGEVTECFELK